MQDDFLTMAQAVQHLTDQVGDDAKYWVNKLANLRKPKRASAFPLAFAKKERGIGYYALSDLARLVEHEKHLRLGNLKFTGRAAEVMRAFGINEPGGSPYGRELKTFRVSEAVIDGDPRTFAQLTVGDPLSVYRIDIEQIENMIAELTEVRGRLKISERG